MEAAPIGLPTSLRDCIRSEFELTFVAVTSLRLGNDPLKSMKIGEKWFQHRALLHRVITTGSTLITFSSTVKVEVSSPGFSAISHSLNLIHPSLWINKDIKTLFYRHMSLHST